MYHMIFGRLGYFPGTVLWHGFEVRGGWLICNDDVRTQTASLVVY